MALVSVGRVLLLAFTTWLSLVLVGLAVSGWILSLLWACKPVSILLQDQLTSGRVCTQKDLEPPGSLVQIVTRRLLSQQLHLRISVLNLLIPL